MTRHAMMPQTAGQTVQLTEPKPSMIPFALVLQTADVWFETGDLPNRTQPLFLLAPKDNHASRSWYASPKDYQCVCKINQIIRERSLVPIYLGMTMEKGQYKG